MIKINDRLISKEHPPYIIAEISANHNGNLQNALKLIELSAEAGADAVKIQTYRPNTITLNGDTSDFLITDGQWKGRTLWDLYDWAHTPWEWHARLFSHAKDVGITLFSSPFDPSAVVLLEELGTPAYKVASFEIVDLPLIRCIASKHKPMIISTGMASLDEIEQAVEAVQEEGCVDLVLLHCVSGYPAPAEEYNLKTLSDIATRFNTVVGLSDHTLDNSVAIASVALGAAVIEKHVTLDRLGGGPDDSFSLEPAELEDLCKGTRKAWEALGKIDYSRKSSELENVKFRRSLYFVKDLKSGDVVTEDAIRSVRPGYGLAPKWHPSIIGKKVNLDIKKYTPVSFDLLDL